MSVYQPLTSESHSMSSMLLYVCAQKFHDFWSLSASLHFCCFNGWRCAT